MPSTLPTRAKAPRDLGDSVDIAGVRAVGKETRTATPEPQSIPRSSAPSIEAPLGDAMAPASPAEIHLARSMTQLGLAHLQILQTTLLDAYQHAVATMDAAAARELASQVVHGLLQVEEARDQIGPGEELVPLRSQLDTAWRSTVSHLTVQMSPQVLGGTAVAESVVPPPLAHVVYVGVELVASEASRVLELLEAAARIAAYVIPEGAETSQPAQPNDALLAVAELQRFASRPIDALFLVALLRRTGAWLELAHARGSDGRTAAEVLGATETQANETGATVELGPEWNAKTAADALSYGFVDWAVTDADGLRVVEMLQAAPPPGRGALIKQLHRMGLLERLAANVGWLPFQQIAETLNDPEAEALLAPHWEGKGGTPSSHQLLMQQVDRNLDEGGALNTLQAGLWYLLDAGLDQFSFGAKPAIDRAHEACDAGLISEDGFWAEADKAMAKAALVAAAAAATGGLAGSWTEGAAFGLGAGEGGAAILGGAFGGAVGNVGAHLSGDLYDQLLNDKHGFDGFASYAQDFAAGGITGAVMAPISLHAAKHLPASARTLAQTYAARHPHLISILESARAAGVGSAFRIRTTVREWLEVLRTGAGGPGAMGGLAGPQLAFSTVYPLPDIQALPPDARICVTARPTVDLDAPMARLGDDDAPWLEVEAVEAADEGSDWRDALGRDDPSIEGMHEFEPLGDEPHQQRLPVAKDVDPSESPDSRSSGFWDDDQARGNNPWYSDNEAVNSVTEYREVEFRDGYPVLDDYTEQTVFLSKMAGDDTDFALADRELARRYAQFKADGTPNQSWARVYRRRRRLTWHHHQDGKRLQLVPSGVHSNVPHSGGASASKNPKEV